MLNYTYINCFIDLLKVKILNNWAEDSITCGPLGYPSIWAKEEFVKSFLMAGV